MINWQDELNKWREGKSSQFDVEHILVMSDYLFQRALDLAGASFGEKIKLTLERTRV